MDLNYKKIFFKYLDGEKEKYKDGKITRERMEDTISIYKISFLKEYYDHVISEFSESEEFMNDFLAFFPKELTE